jgi:hypothetical protein
MNKSLPEAANDPFRVPRMITSAKNYIEHFGITAFLVFKILQKFAIIGADRPATATAIRSDFIAPDKLFDGRSSGPIDSRSSAASPL